MTVRTQPNVPRPARRTSAARAGLAVLAVVGGLALSACGKHSEGPDIAPPGRTEKIAGSKIPRVILTAAAAKRIDLRTAAVVAGAGGTGVAIPYAAVLYDPDGQASAFVKKSSASASELVFVRTPVTVEAVEGDVAHLSSGPPIAAEVVSLGAAELYGVEIGVGNE